VITMLAEIGAIAGILILVSLIVAAVAIRETEQRRREEAAEAVYQAMAAGSRLRQSAWRARHQMRNLHDDDVIDIEPEEK
jgi:ribosomal protein L20A (L18A)